VSDLIKAIREAFEFSESVSDGMIITIFIVGLMLVVLSVVALVISIWLAVSYHVYNKTKNSIGKTGEEIARDILDKNGLQNIRVSKNGSILFGNSYSHYFKKVRLRRLTWKKDSVTSLAMAAQKSSLAVLDKENDPAMKLQIRLTPIIYFGPIAFVPLIIVGVLLDLFVIKANNVYATITCCGIGMLFYVISFIFSILILKTEKAAQEKALELMKVDNLATDEEIEMCKKLFKLYNIEYINNMIIALLELVYRVLLLVASAQSGSSMSSSSSND
jgi:uncharacterized protein